MADPRKIYPLDISEFAPPVGRDQFAVTDQVARDWFEGFIANSAVHQHERANVERLRAMLSRAFLPEEPDAGLVERTGHRMDVAGYRSASPAAIREVIRILRAELTAPKTKTVWDVTVFGLPTQRSEREEHVLDVIREFGANHEIRIAPVEVPAD